MKERLVPLVFLPILFLVTVPNSSVLAINCYDGRGNAYREVSCNTTVKWCSKVTQETGEEDPIIIRGCHYKIPDDLKDSCEEEDLGQNSKVISCWCQNNVCNNTTCQKPFLFGLFLVVFLLLSK